MSGGDCDCVGDADDDRDSIGDRATATPTTTTIDVHGEFVEALVLYEIGDRDESITKMEDVSVALRGYSEIHAALAVALYTDKHALLLAENQFTIATLLDPHYTDLTYARETKHWLSSLIASLRNFITLS